MTRAAVVFQIIAAALFPGAAADTGGLSARAVSSLAPAELKMGEPVFIDIELRYGPGTPPPALVQPRRGDWALKGEKRAGAAPVREGAEVVDRRRLEVVPFAVGDVQLGPFLYESRSGEGGWRAETSTLRVRVRRARAEGDGRPDPPEPPRVKPPSAGPYALWLALSPSALGAAGALFLSVWRRGRERAAPVGRHPPSRGEAR